MGCISKDFSLLIVVILAASSLITIESASAQSTPKPSAPELTIKFIDRSYDVPLIYKTSTNPYTGQQETTSEGGYRVENKTIELKIKNPLYDEREYLHYNVRVKGHFTINWTTLYGAIDNYSPPMSDSDYTAMTFIDSHDGSFSGPGGAKIIAPLGGKIDIQVAVCKQSVETYGDPHIQFSWGYRYVYTQLGDWSNTQTITIPEGSVSTSTSPNPTPSPTNTEASPTPNVPEFPILAILPFFLSLLLVAVYRKHRRTIYE